MWNLNPRKLCDKHLLGEHKEMHQVVGSLNAGRSIKGHVEMGQLEVHNIRKRHDELVREMKNRGFNHKSPLDKFKKFKAGYIDKEFNRLDLSARCELCKF